MPSRQAYEIAAKRLADVLRTDKLAEIEQQLSGNISQYLGLSKDQTTSISLGLPDVDQMFEDITVLKIRESQALLPLDITDIGSGYLSLFRLATLRTLANMTGKGSGIYIIEEPEIYLHPHLQQFFFSTIKKLASQGNIMIFSTHSQEFVGLDAYQSIVRVEKRNDATAVQQVPKTVTLDFDHIHLRWVST
jgi:predicted ATP-dependent endonuclease of OLD family